MKRFNAIWLYTGSYSDETRALGEGLVPLTLTANQTLYLGLDDWFSGVLTFISTVPDPSPDYILEYFNGDEWKAVPLEETLSNQAEGTILQRGSLYWGIALTKWAQLAFNTTVPEVGTPVTTQPYYWVRLRVIANSITIDRILPQLFNTYATIEDMASYIGFEFDEVHAPTIETVRRMLRSSEDWFDTHTRRTFRPRVAYSETHDFNAYGVRLRRYPPWFLISVGVWSGSTLNYFTEGRNKEFYLDQSTGMLRFNLPAWRTRSTSFLLNRYMRMPASLEVTYAYGEDFDVSQYAGTVREIILMKTGSKLVNQNDWTGIFTSGLDTVPKREKMRAWDIEATRAADELRIPLIS